MVEFDCEVGGGGCQEGREEGPHHPGLSVLRPAVRCTLHTPTTPGGLVSSRLGPLLMHINPKAQDFLIFLSWSRCCICYLIYKNLVWKRKLYK